MNPKFPIAKDSHLLIEAFNWKIFPDLFSISFEDYETFKSNVGLGIFLGEFFYDKLKFS